MQLAIKKATENGETIDISRFTKYLKRFPHIILWGGGNLGQEIGKKIAEFGVKITNFWDVNHEKIGDIGGVKVTEPFTGNYNLKTTLIIFCISNGVAAPNLVQKLQKQKNVLLGADIYRTIFCPQNEKTFFNGGDCSDTICNIRTCTKLDSLLLKQQREKKPVQDYKTAPIQVANIIVVVNQKCTLKCRECGSYMNSYPFEKRINFPLERILEDIDIFFNSVDSIRQVTLFGGEPFLHPKLTPILNAILEYPHFANFSLNTSAICKIAPSVLAGINDDRFSISISNYCDHLNDKQKKLYGKNLSIIKNSGIKYRETKPIWIQPSTFIGKSHSTKTMTAMTDDCRVNTLCSELKNGKFFPCTFASSIYSLNIHDFESDYVDLIKLKNNEKKLRSKINHLYNKQSYYASCNLCGIAENEQQHDFIPAGEQGVNELYLL